MDSVIVHAAMAEAAATGTPVAELSLDRIARRAGISRSTIYRVGVADRAIAAATEVITADGVAALTVDGVARRVGCSVSAVHTAFGGREGLLAAVFERHAPLPTVVQLMSEHPERFTDLEGGVRAIYTVVFDTVTGQQGGTGVLEALFAEVLAKPNGVAAQLLRDRTDSRGPLRGPAALAVGAAADLADQRAHDCARQAEGSRRFGAGATDGD
jgi:AcrR family transcriptional regulator